MADTKQTDYTLKNLQQIHVDAFRSVAACYPKGALVGTRPWTIRILPAATVLVCPYSLKQEDGSWKDYEKAVTL